jgi:hypothetical protein
MIHLPFLVLCLLHRIVGNPGSETFFPRIEPNNPCWWCKYTSFLILSKTCNNYYNNILFVI